MSRKLPKIVDKDVFVSYSRKDKDTVSKLCELLTERGRKPWVDWDGIPPSEKWLARIKEGIDSADIFLFVLSPDSVTSKVCIEEELVYAQQSEKKIIPLLVREFSNSDIPEEFLPAIKKVQELNYIFFRKEDDYDTAADKVIVSISTDFDHIRQHTEYLRQAREWEDKRRRNSRLLRGDALTAAEKWIRRIGDTKPPASELHREFIKTSRIISRKRTRRMVAISTVTLLILGLLAVSALLFNQQADDEEANALLEKARQFDTDHRPFAAAMVAGKALGFEGYGDSLLTRRSHPRLPTSGSDTEEQLRSILAANSRMILPIWKSPRVDRNQVKDGDFSSDGRLFVSANTSGKIQVWNFENFSESSASIQGELNAVAFSPDATRIVSGSSQGMIQLWNTGSISKNPITSISGHRGSILSIAFSPDGQLIATAGEDSDEIKIWDARLESSQPVATFSDHTKAVNSVVFSPNGKLLASAGNDFTARIWDLQSNRQVAKFLVGGEVHTVSFNPNGLEIATGSENAGNQKGMIKLWKTNGSPTPTISREAHRRFISSIDYRSDGQVLASSSIDGSVRIWSIDSFRSSLHQACSFFPCGENGFVWDVDFSPNGNSIATSGIDGTTQLWDVQMAAPKPVSIVRNGPNLSQTQESKSIKSPSGNWLAVAEGEKIKLFAGNQPQGDPAAVFRDRDGEPIVQLAFSPDGKRLASGSRHGVIEFWDTETLKSESLSKLVSGFYQITDLEYSPDRKIFGVTGSPAANTVIGDEGGLIRIYDIQFSSPAQFISIPRPYPVTGLSFSSDGNTLSTSNEIGETTTWAMRSHSINLANYLDSNWYQIEDRKLKPKTANKNSIGPLNTQ